MYFIQMKSSEGKTKYWYEFDVSSKHKTLFESYNACRDTMMIFLKLPVAKEYYDVEIKEE